MKFDLLLPNPDSHINRLNIALLSKNYSGNYTLPDDQDLIQVLITNSRPFRSHDHHSEREPKEGKPLCRRNTRMRPSHKRKLNLQLPNTTLSADIAVPDIDTADDVTTSSSTPAFAATVAEVAAEAEGLSKECSAEEVAAFSAVELIPGLGTLRYDRGPYPHRALATLPCAALRRCSALSCVRRPTRQQTIVGPSSRYLILVARTSMRFLGTSDRLRPSPADSTLIKSGIAGPRNRSR